MGCFLMLAALILFSTGLDRIDKNPTLGLILISLSIILGFGTWFFDREIDDEV